MPLGVNSCCCYFWLLTKPKNNSFPSTRAGTMDGNAAATPSVAAFRRKTLLVTFALILFSPLSAPLGAN